MPMLIFKRKTLPKKIKWPKGVVVHVHPKGWMDEEGCKLWLDKVWRHRPAAARGLRNPRSLLVWDQFSAHLTESVSTKVRSMNTDVAVIPGGLTGVLQHLTMLSLSLNGKNCLMVIMLVMINSHIIHYDIFLYCFVK